MVHSMQEFFLSKKSISNLKRVNKNLVDVVNAAIKQTPIDFCVIEGIRSPKRQRELFDSGKSKTLNSRHLTGHAVDLGAWVNGKLNWEWNYYQAISIVMKQEARDLGIAIEWGGDWETFKDGVHFELPRSIYPDTGCSK